MINRYLYIMGQEKTKLKKELGLLDIVAISTGAMFSSGFFLLPGIAAQQAGPAVFLSYLLAAILILPAMFSMAELATATPRAGGAYFFIDRSLGPLYGTIGGIGSYLALILKTAFALVGIGAYAALFFEIPIKLTAIIFGVIFMLMNILGVDKASGLQKIFLFILLVILGFFIGEGMREIFFSAGRDEYLENFLPFLPNGFEGLISTTALVFVSYLGLTHIVSMSEEIKSPERNIPLGMVISLLITSIIYVLGVFIMVGIIPSRELWTDLAPASTASSSIYSLISPGAGTFLITIAAVTAFASTGNAGLMTASRYPFAMSRDKLLPEALSLTSKFKTPVLSVTVTSAILLIIILLVSERDIAKFASSFQLMIFILINVSVIVMRESKIEAYDPGYHSPFYPWLQIFGIISSFFLIIYLGWSAGLFIMGITALSITWYWYYARKNTRREGAIYHWFALLGQKEDKALESEFLDILKEKGLREGDPFGEMIVKSSITDLGKRRISFQSLIMDITKKISRDFRGIDAGVLKKEFLSVTTIDPAMIIPGVSILHGKVENIDQPVLHIVLSDKGVKMPAARGRRFFSETERTRVFFFLLSRVDEPKQQLRILSRLMDIVERDRFVKDITSIRNHREIKEYLLHNDRYITLHLKKGTIHEDIIDKALKEIKLPNDVLVAIVQRKDQIFTPRGDTVLRENDIITIIGEPRGIKTLFEKYIHNQPQA
jgi:basic amino acid/polyamine antiporter, APA family